MALQRASIVTVKVSSRGRVVIPAKLRKKYNLKPGTRVRFVDYDGIVSLVPASADPAKHAAKMLKGGPSLARALLQERHKEQRRGR